VLEGLGVGCDASIAQRGLNDRPDGHCSWLAHPITFSTRNRPASVLASGALASASAVGSDDCGIVAPRTVGQRGWDVAGMPVVSTCCTCSTWQHVGQLPRELFTFGRG
jgi:hypothetical protein